MESKSIVDRVSNAMSERKAKDIEVIEVSKVTFLTDFFVLCSGTSRTHIRAIADEVETALEKEGITARKEGMNNDKWILMDYGSVVVHVFDQEARNFYRPERLWSDSETIE